MTAFATGAFERIEAQLVDGRYKLRPEPGPQKDLLLVQIDARWHIDETAAAS